MTMKRTKAGQDSSSPRPEPKLTKHAHALWRECFAAAIAGTISAHRGVPNPDVVIRLAATMADRALTECRKRSKVALLFMALSPIALDNCAGSPSKPSSSIGVQYLVTGSSSRASMTYATAGSGTAQQSDRAIPWSFSTTMAPGDFAYISAQNSGQTGCVSVEIRVRGDYFKSTQSCGAYVIATASGTVE